MRMSVVVYTLDPELGLGATFDAPAQQGLDWWSKQMQKLL